MKCYDDMMEPHIAWTGQIRHSFPHKKLATIMNRTLVNICLTPAGDYVIFEMIVM